METTSKDETQKPALLIEAHPGYPEGGQIYVTTGKRKYHENESNIQKMRDEGLSDTEIADRLDSEHAERWKKIRQENSKMWAQTEEDDYDGTDPLAGDVEPTGGYYEEPQHPLDAHREAVARQHGD